MKKILLVATMGLGLAGIQFNCSATEFAHFYRKAWSMDSHWLTKGDPLVFFNTSFAKNTSGIIKTGAGGIIAITVPGIYYVTWRVAATPAVGANWLQFCLAEISSEGAEAHPIHGSCFSTDTTHNRHDLSIVAGSFLMEVPETASLSAPYALGLMMQVPATIGSSAIGGVIPQDSDHGVALGVHENSTSITFQKIK